MKRKYYIGVDGGASKTEVALIDEKGRIIGTEFGAGSHIGVRVSKSYAKVIKELMGAVCKSADIKLEQVAGFGFGLCGCDYPQEHKGQKKSLVKHLAVDDEKTTLVNDGVAALWGGAKSEAAVILQVGTGFTAGYRSKFGGEKPFDQVNCGVVVNPRIDFYITAARVLDGRDAPSIIPQLMMDYFNEHDPGELIRKLRRKYFSKDKVANILPVWTLAIKKKDKVAIRLMETAAKSYAHDIDTLIKKTGATEVEVVLGGGVLQNGPPALVRRISKIVRTKNPKVKVHKPYLSPAIGAAIMAAFNDGKNPKKIFSMAKKTTW